MFPLLVLLIGMVFHSVFGMLFGSKLCKKDLRAKILNVFKKIFYVRWFLFFFPMIMLFTVSEVKDFETKSNADKISLLFSVMSLIGAIVILAFLTSKTYSIYMAYEEKGIHKQIIRISESLFCEFFCDIKTTNKATLYPLTNLLRIILYVGMIELSLFDAKY